MSDSKKNDIPAKPKSDSAERTTEPEGLYIDLKNAQNAPQIFADFDSLQRFKLKTTLDFMDKFSNQMEKSTALYEKLILLDGATIALSVTLLTSFSSRWAGLSTPERPHIWMVDVSWCLLLISIYCSYQVIVRRNTVTLSIFLKFASELTKYTYERLTIVCSYLQKFVKGKIPFGNISADSSTFFKIVPSLLNQEKEASLKKISDTIVKLNDGASMESVFARIAVYSTILAVTLLCIFTILSLRLLF